MANSNPKPPKRKKRTTYSRHASGAKLKQSNYNFSAAREELGIPNANTQQIRSAALQTGATPRAPKGKSPVKQVIKAHLTREQHKVTKLNLGKKRLEMKVDSLKQQLRNFSIALKDEKHKSRLAMASLLNDAEKMVADFLDDRDHLDTKMSAAELAIEKERQRSHGAVHKEREYMSLKISACKSF